MWSTKICKLKDDMATPVSLERKVFADRIGRLEVSQTMGGWPRSQLSTNADAPHLDFEM
jgi:hypothetical protein